MILTGRLTLEVSVSNALRTSCPYVTSCEAVSYTHLKRQHVDDALKFRAIRAWGGCDANDVLWLNKVFDIHRDEKACLLYTSHECQSVGHIIRD